MKTAPPGIRTWDEVRRELERRHGLRLSLRRVWQIGKAAERKLRQRLKPFLQEEP